MNASQFFALDEKNQDGWSVNWVEGVTDIVI